MTSCPFIDHEKPEMNKPDYARWKWSIDGKFSSKSLKDNFYKIF